MNPVRSILRRDIFGRDMTLYHGTNSENYKKISKQGLVPYKSMWSHKPLVFLTANKEGARNYAKRRANQGGKPVVLVVEVPDEWFTIQQYKQSKKNPYSQLLTENRIPIKDIRVSKNKRIK